MKSSDLIAILIGVLLYRAAHAIDSSHKAARCEWAALHKRITGRQSCDKSM